MSRSRYIDANYFARQIEDVIKSQRYDELVTLEKGFPTVADVLATVVDELRGKSLNGFELCPTSDVRENVHGEWIKNEGGFDPRDNFYHCSKCGRVINVICGDTLDNYPFCHCGADMRE